MPAKYVLAVGLLMSLVPLVGQETQTPDSIYQKEWQPLFRQTRYHASRGADSALYYLEQLRLFNEQYLPDSTECIAAADGLEVYYYFYSDQMEVVLEKGQVALTKAKALGEWDWAVDDLLHLGYAYRQLGQVSKAIDCFTAGLEGSIATGL